MKKEQTVYVIEKGEYSGFDWYGVFVSRKEAEEHILHLLNTNHYYIVNDENDEKITFKSYKEYEKIIEKDSWNTFSIVETELNSLKMDTFGIWDDKEANKKYRKWKLNRIKERENKK